MTLLVTLDFPLFYSFKKHRKFFFSLYWKSSLGGVQLSLLFFFFTFLSLHLFFVIQILLQSWLIIKIDIFKSKSIFTNCYPDFMKKTENLYSIYYFQKNLFEILNGKIKLDWSLIILNKDFFLIDGNLMLISWILF